MTVLTTYLMLVALTLGALGHDLAAYAAVIFAGINQALFTWAGRPDEDTP